MKNDKVLFLLLGLLVGALLLAVLGFILLQNPDEGLPWEEPTPTSTRTPLPPTGTSTPTATSTGTRRPTRTPVPEPSEVLPTETSTPSVTPLISLTPTPTQSGFLTPQPTVLSATPTNTPTASQTAVSASTPTVSPTPHTGSARITGRVVNEGVPISNITITLEGFDILTATTGTDGGYQFEVDWLDEEFSVVFSLGANPQLSPPGDYILWSWIESTLVGHTTMPDLEISTTPAGTLFSQTSPANNSYYAAAQITSTNPLTFEWSAYPQAEEYWVDLGLDGIDYALWSSDAVQDLSVDFTGTLNNSARITPRTYWWSVGSIREENDFRILTYTQTWTLYITP